MGESPEIKNWKSLWTSLSDAKIGQIWVYHVARVLGEETIERGGEKTGEAPVPFDIEENEVATSVSKSCQT